MKLFTRHNVMRAYSLRIISIGSMRILAEVAGVIVTTTDRDIARNSMICRFTVRLTKRIRLHCRPAGIHIMCPPCLTTCHQSMTSDTMWRQT